MKKFKQLFSLVFCARASYRQCDPAGYGLQSQNLQQTPLDPEQPPDKHTQQSALLKQS